MRRLIPAAILFLLGGMGIALSVPVHADNQNYADSVTYLHRQVDGLDIEYALVDQPEGLPYEDPYTLTGYPLPGGHGTWSYNPAGSTRIVDVGSAIAGWNNVTPNLQLSYAGMTTVTSNLCNGSGQDGLSTIGWGPTGAGILAVACWASGGECDIIISNTTVSSADIRTVLMHELGHCVGLGHSADPTALMFPTYHGVMAGPAGDDIAGVCAMYGCPVTPTPTQQPPTSTPTSVPTATNTPLPTFTPTATPTPSRGCWKHPLLKHCVVLPFVARDG